MAVPAEPEATTGGSELAPASPTPTGAPATSTTAPDADAPVAFPAATPGTYASTPVGETIAPAEASPAALDPQARLDRFMAISATLVGGGRLQPDRGQQFLALADADPERRAALDALIAAGPDALAAPTALPAASPGATPTGATPEIDTGRGGSELVATPEDAGGRPDDQPRTDHRAGQGQDHDG